MDLFALLAPNRRRAWLVVAVFVVLGLPLHYAIKTAGDRGLLMLGEGAPVLQGPTLAGDDCEFDSTREHGRLLVVFFADPTRAASDEQAEIFEVWREKFAPQGDRFVFVTVLTGGTVAQGEAFAQAHDLPLADVVVDRGGYRKKPFHVRKTPTLYVIDPTGRICFAAEGVLKKRDRKFNKVLTEYSPRVRMKPRKSCRRP